MKLNQKKCIPCEGGLPKLSELQIKELMKSIDSAWLLIDNFKIIKDFRFVNFIHTMNFANKIAALAEKEGHHPALNISYGKCVVELFTFSINGLSENDFILASKIDELD
jgi:4a-hydroxytetrahydrobiopterin dehydratase